jgi:hypothetical protein
MNVELHDCRKTNSERLQSNQNGYIIKISLLFYYLILYTLLIRTLHLLHVRFFFVFALSFLRNPGLSFGCRHKIFTETEREDQPFVVVRNMIRLVAPYRANMDPG